MKIDHIIELLFMIGTIGLVLTHASQTSQVITGLGSNYQGLVKGLEGRQ